MIVERMIPIPAGAAEIRATRLNSTTGNANATHLERAVSLDREKKEQDKRQQFPFYEKNKRIVEEEQPVAAGESADASIDVVA
jgi:hypothetical protein